MLPVVMIRQMQDRLTPVFRKNGVRKATLFGSYSRGQATASSDIDLLVDSGLRGLQFFGLLEDVCQSLQHDINLVDVPKITPGSKIDQEIRRMGIVTYEQ